MQRPGCGRPWAGRRRTSTPVARAAGAALGPSPRLTWDAVRDERWRVEPRTAIGPDLSEAAAGPPVPTRPPDLFPGAREDWRGRRRLRGDGRGHRWNSVP